MTVESVKRKLKSVQNLKIRLMVLEQRIKELEEQIDDVSAVDYSSVKVKASKGNSVEARYIQRADRLKDLQDAYMSIFDELCAVEDELGERMKRLNPTEYQVIYERYLKGSRLLSLNAAAKKFGYSIDGIKTIQKRAFKKMADF